MQYPGANQSSNCVTAGPEVGRAEDCCMNRAPRQVCARRIQSEACSTPLALTQVKILGNTPCLTLISASGPSLKNPTGSQGARESLMSQHPHAQSRRKKGEIGVSEANGTYST